MIPLPKGLIDLPDGRLASGIRCHEGGRAPLDMDALSEILRGIRLTGSAFIDAELSAPWSVQTPTVADLAKRLAPHAGRIIPYHLIVQGTCTIRVGPEPPLVVEAPAVVCFPHGDVHQLASDAELEPEPITTQGLIALTRADEISRVSYGGGGRKTKLVCGFFTCDRALSDHLITQLPRALKFRVGVDSAAMLLSGAVRETHLHRERGAKPGTQAVLCKLSELLFVEAVRSHLDALHDPSSGWLAGLKDRYVSAALALIHGEPGRAWTLDLLAAASGTSRSTLAERFIRIMGQAPMQYLWQWRLHLAADALASSDRGMKNVAGDAGFGSIAAFGRAFKREFGVSPARWRRSSTTD
jgi:AraC family transcriptional regulator, alkane utilization regulator